MRFSALNSTATLSPVSPHIRSENGITSSGVTRTSSTMTDIKSQALFDPMDTIIEGI
jgi:hypothetical protein